VTTPRRPDFLRSFLRSFAIQGSWNHSTFLAGGLVYAMLPLLARIHRGDPVERRRAVHRHLGSFNAHPCLAPLAVGALARLEAEGRDDAVIRRFRDALTGALGAVGDRLIWSGWRPFCLLAGVTAYSLGAGPWTAVLLFLVPYNVGQVLLRAWAFRRGWEDGLEASDVLSGPLPGRAARLLASASALLAGAAAAAVAYRFGAGGGHGALAGLAAVPAAAAGHRWPGAAGRLAAILLAAAVALGAA
jgi:mannose/fructose/N-acetylgalactosamine-specific phosphotransferase system component IID